MLRQSSLGTPSFGGLVEHECPRCHRPVELPLGEICAACEGEIARRANRLARTVAMVSTAAVGVYVMWRVPPDPTARAVSGASVAVWYLLTYMIAKRIAREALRTR